MARSITTRSTNPKIMDDNIKILDDALGNVSAEGVPYDNTDSGLTADDVQGAIDELAPKVLYTFTPDGETTASEALDAMYAEVDLSYDCYILFGTSFLPCTGIVDDVYYFASFAMTGNTIYGTGLEVKSSGSKVTSPQLKTTGNTFIDNSDGTDIGFTVYKRI